MAMLLALYHSQDIAIHVYPDPDLPPPQHICVIEATRPVMNHVKMGIYRAGRRTLLHCEVRVSFSVLALSIWRLRQMCCVGCYFGDRAISVLPPSSSVARRSAVEAGVFSWRCPAPVTRSKTIIHNAAVATTAAAAADAAEINPSSTVP